MAATAGPQAGTEKPNFQYTSDAERGGVSAFYDTSKFDVTPLAMPTLAKDAKALAFLFQPIKTEIAADGSVKRVPDGKPILYVIAHGPSGKEPKDVTARTKAFGNIKTDVATLAKEKGCEDIVYSLDANISAYVPKDPKKTDEPDDFVLNRGGMVTNKKGDQVREEGVTTLFEDLIPADATIEGCVTSEAIVDKTRGGDMGGNQQLTKANIPDFGAKAYCIHAKVMGDDVADKAKARADSVEKALAGINKPNAVLTFGEDDTEGADHKKTPRLEVRKLGFVTRPLINTFGSRGYGDPALVYTQEALKSENAERNRKIREEATYTFLDIVIEALKNAGVTEVVDKDGKSTSIATVEGHNVAVATRAKFIVAAEDKIIENEGILKKILDKFVNSGAFQAWDALFLDTERRFKNEEDILECIGIIRTKNYIKIDTKTDALTDPKKESIHIKVDKANGKISYRIANLTEDVIVEGTVDFTMKGDTLSDVEKLDLREAVISDAKRILHEKKSVRPDFASLVMKEMAAEQIATGGTKLEANTLYLSKIPEEKGQTYEFEYSLMLADGLKCTGTIKGFRLEVGTDEATRKSLIREAVKADVNKKKFEIINGKDLVGNTAEFMRAQFFSGFPAEFGGQHPFIVQMEGSAKIVEDAAKTGQSVDVIMSTELPDFSHTDPKPTEKKDADLATAVGYPAYLKKQLLELCAAMNERRKPKIEPMPKAVPKAEAEKTEQDRKGEAKEKAKRDALIKGVRTRIAAATIPTAGSSSAYSGEGVGRKDDLGRRPSASNVAPGVLGGSSSSSSEPLGDRRQMTAEEMEAIFGQNPIRKSYAKELTEREANKTGTSKVKSKFPKGEVAGFGLGGFLIGAAIAIAIVGLPTTLIAAWPIAVAAVSAAVVFAAGKAVHAKMAEGASKARGAMSTLEDAGAERRGASKVVPPATVPRTSVNRTEESTLPPVAAREEDASKSSARRPSQ